METPSDTPIKHPKIGTWIASCGPKPTPWPSSVVVCCFAMILAIALPFVPFFVHVPPERAGHNWPLYGASAFFVLGCVTYVVILLKFSRSPQVDLYTGGVRYETNDEEWILTWQEMAHVKIVTIYDTWYSHYRTCMITNARHKVLRFDDRVRGEPEKVINAIRRNAPHVEETELDMGA